MKHIGMLWILGCLLFSPLLGANGISVEYKIKAGYLYNFTKFVSWPEDMAETFNLCIMGDDPFGELIDPIEQRIAFGRPIKLFRFDSPGHMKKHPHCHILFVSASIEDQLADWDVDKTLTVGESKEFAAHGGMISFVNRLGKIKLQINLKTIKQSGLKVSAKLLEVAEVVKGDNNE